MLPSLVSSWVLALVATSSFIYPSSANPLTFDSHTFRHLIKRQEPTSKPTACPDNLGQSPSPYFGTILDWSNDSPDRYVSLLGRTPSVFGSFLRIGNKFEDQEMMRHLKLISNVVKTATVKDQDGNDVQTSIKPMYALSVDPVDKFDGISDAAMTVLANLCLKAHQDGIFVVIRFAHEMNGEWYTWGLQPQAFIETYRRLYTTVKTISPATNFIWAPNIYPGGSNGTTYSTYYPGDSYIDWVGLSYYHFGATWPPVNSLAPPNKLTGGITGTLYPTDTDPALNFYRIYSQEKNKPFVIAETGAPAYSDRTKEPADLAEINQKRSWWTQVYNTTVFSQFPNLKMILWFEYTKREVFGANGDHRVVMSPNAEIREAFKRDLPVDSLTFNENRIACGTKAGAGLSVWVWVGVAIGLVVVPAIVVSIYRLRISRNKKRNLGHSVNSSNGTLSPHQHIYGVHAANMMTDEKKMANRGSVINGVGMDSFAESDLGGDSFEESPDEDEEEYKGVPEKQQ